MDRKTFTIGVLTVTAVLFIIAHLFPVRTAVAGDSARDRDYQIVTARLTQGGEGLYVIEQRSGLVAVFTWDAGQRRVVLRAVRSVNDAILQ